MHALADRSRTPLAGGILGSLLCHLAHPPWGASMLAWAGPVFWLRLAESPQPLGKQGYRRLWLAGWLYWLLTIHWLRLAHPSNYVAWLLLSGYLACYLPLAVGMMRGAVHLLRVPLWAAAPVAWTALEGLRGRLFTGFSMASLAHTQANNPVWIQLADVGGEYAVTFAILLFAGLLTEALPGPRDGAPRGKGRRRAAALAAAGLLALTAGYGRMRLQAYAGGEAGPLVALVQGNALADWKGTPEKEAAMMREQFDLSLAAGEAARALRGSGPDLIAWAETMFRQPLVALADDDPRLRALVGDEALRAAGDDLAALARRTGAALIVGIDRFEARLEADEATGAPQATYAGFNSSVGVTRQGRLAGSYDKMHLLPLGEYVPLAEWIPVLRRLTPVTGFARPGAGPTALKLDGVVYAPNICYESAVPHLIRDHLRQLARRGERPDVLVNLTNDAWYWGSSELDMHLACGMLRCVETRTPMVIAANRGLSAHIDAAGRLVASTARNQPAFLLADVRLVPAALRGGESWYVAGGDWLPLVCGVACAAGVGVGWKRRRSCVTVAETAGDAAGRPERASGGARR
jgi:apolipoprotein N-acyltransferase